MIVKLFDKTEIIVTKNEALKIADAVNRGVKLISINGHMINPTAIALIKPGGITEAEINPKKLLDRPDHRGLASPAKEVLREKYGHAKS